MSLPFTRDAFLEVFARYNAAVWPIVVALWVAAADVLGAVVRAPGARTSRLASAVGLLSVSGPKLGQRRCNVASIIAHGEVTLWHARCRNTTNVVVKSERLPEQRE